MYRPEGWAECPCDNCKDKVIDDWGYFCDLSCGKQSAWVNHGVGADAMLEGLKKEGLYGKYLEDYIISVAVKPDDKDWAESFLARIKNKGYLVFIPEEG